MTTLNFHLVTADIPAAQKGDREAAKEVLIAVDHYLQNDPNCPEELKKYWSVCTDKLKNGVDPMRALNLGGKSGPKYNKDAWQYEYDVAEAVFLEREKGITKDKAIEIVALKHSYALSTVQKYYEKYRESVETDYSFREKIDNSTDS
jgi:hypothetical protein